MADNDANSINSVNQSIADYIETMSLDTEQVIRSIDLTLKSIARKDGLIISQSSLRDLADAEAQNAKVKFSEAQGQPSNTQRGNRATDRRRASSYSIADDDIHFDKDRARKRAGNMFDQLTDDFEEAFTEALFGSANPLKDALSKSISEFAKSLDTTVDGLGKEIGRRAGEMFKNHPLGKRLAAEQEWMARAGTSILNRGLSSLSNILGGTGQVGNVGPGGQGAPRPGNMMNWARDFFNGVRSDIYNPDAFANASQQQAAQYAEQQAANSASQQQATSSQASNIVNSARDDAANAVRDAVEGVDYREIDTSDVLEHGMDAASDVVGEVLKGSVEGADDLVSALGKVSNSAVGAARATEAVGSAAGAASAAEAAAAEATATASTTLPALAGATAETTAGLTAAGAAATGASIAFPWATIAILAATVAIDQFSEALEPTIEGLKGFWKAIKESANRDLTEYSQNAALARERVKKDIESITTLAYEVIQDSAKRIMDIWDNVENVVSAAQGYDKAGVQELWSSYASRLKEEGLASVVSSADIMEKLKGVLDSGLSGKAAEEFAYQATLLSSAYPVEDFFQYANTYASLVANSIRTGMSQQEAIEVANDELRGFADNLIYANKEVSGGLTTSLKSASSLFQESAEIALASRKGDVSEISRVLTTISAFVGSVAPDLVENVMSAVKAAAIGGNSSEITALRSFAGTGASNTAFLQALAKDPQKVLSTMFKNLSQLQNMSASNYMEVAEGLSQVFGLNMDSFARVDFFALGDAIEKMATATGSLDDSIDLLKSGETTSNAEQFRMQKINEYMIEEGLAYVLDNEVARQVQDHLWEEQLMRELASNTFAVNLQGAGMDLLVGLFTTIRKIQDAVSIRGWARKLTNIELTKLEMAEGREDLAQILELGKVGEGNQTEFTQLTKIGVDHNMDTPYLDLLRGQTRLENVQAMLDYNNKRNNSLLSIAQSGFNKLTDATNDTTDAITNGLTSQPDDNVNDLSFLIEKGASSLSQIGDTLEVETADIAGSADATRVSASMTAQSAAASLQSSQIVAKSAVNLQAATESLSAETSKSTKNTFFVKSIVSKGFSQIIKAVKSGDWRTNKSYDAIWSNFESSRTSAASAANSVRDAAQLSEEINKSIKDYVTNYNEQVTALDPVRSKVIEDEKKLLIERDAAILAEEKEIKHRSYYTQEDMVKQVTDQLRKMETENNTGSFDDWLARFDRDVLKGGNLTAILSDYGENIETIRALYETEESSQADISSKARQLHEVQFWEDMQQFATKDFPWYMREWERYYIQHEAYAMASDQAQNAAVELKVKEQGEFGDSVFALAKALVENNNWQEELGDRLKEPQLQANAMIAQLVLLVDAIRQQNNQSQIVSVPTALSALGLGVSNV